MNGKVISVTEVKKIQTITRRMAAVMAGTAIAALVGGGVANADEWPPIPVQPSVSTPFEATNFLTPTDPDYYNPFVEEARLTSPFGTRNRIVCTAFHGVSTGCWQADDTGAPHQLVALPVDFPNFSGSLKPGGGPKHYVYPDLLPSFGS